MPFCNFFFFMPFWVKHSDFFFNISVSHNATAQLPVNIVGMSTHERITKYSTPVATGFLWYMKTAQNKSSLTTTEVVKRTLLNRFVFLLGDRSLLALQRTFFL